VGRGVRPKNLSPFAWGEGVRSSLIIHLTIFYKPLTLSPLPAMRGEGVRPKNLSPFAWGEGVRSSLIIHLTIFYKPLTPSLSPHCGERDGVRGNLKKIKFKNKISKSRNRLF
jgi:hypothetical protein